MVVLQSMSIKLYTCFCSICLGNEKHVLPREKDESHNFDLTLRKLSTPIIAKVTLNGGSNEMCMPCKFSVCATTVDAMSSRHVIADLAKLTFWGIGNHKQGNSVSWHMPGKVLIHEILLSQYF